MALHSTLPEPLRTAHLIAGGVTRARAGIGRDGSAKGVGVIKV